MSAKRRAMLAAQGVAHPSSTLVTRTVTNTRARDTGPKQSTRDVVKERSGGMCEWPACPEMATDIHHRLNRKDGGRHGEARERLNGPQWLLHACREHHRKVTSAWGAVLILAKRMGWVLMEHQDALRVPVLTRHDEYPVWLLPDGKWLTYEEACA